MKKSTIASLIGLSFTSPIFAAETIALDEVTVKANRFERKDTETTYASEIHTAAQIEASGAATLYEYLAQQTSLNASPNIGNRATPAINLRGFGTENGHQNVVITVDGQRLNSIDLSPSVLAGIALGNIERIEIAKGSGSVIYGDGATAGSIQIYTKNKTGVSISSSLGNFGQKNSNINAGISEKHIDLSVNLAHDSHDGFSKKDETGHKDQFTSNSQNAKLRIKPTDDLRFNIEGTSSRNDVRYVNALTQDEFRDDPRQVTQRSFSQTYTHQSFNSDQWRVGGEYDVNDQIRISAFHYQEDKFSEFISSTPSTAKSLYKGNDISISYQSDSLSLLAGYQDFDGSRKSFSDYSPWGTSKDETTKKNDAIYVSGEYKINALTLSAGARNEQVKYQFSPSSYAFGPVTGAKKSADIDAFDIGANYRFNDKLSAFTNYNQAYQAPDIDRLFTFGGGFNGFLDPAKVRTLNAGLNHVSPKNRLKITVFRANLDNEIYLDPTFGFFGTNSNLDKTYKYGLELQDHFKFNNDLSASVIYNYTRAIVDKETTLDGSVISNKDLPGAPKHSIVANLNYKFFDHASLNLNHTWRSKAYAFNDFENNFSQKQDSYNSTNIALNYQYRNLNFFTSINNIFDQENSIQVQDNAIYPVDFVRTWRVGMKADF
jgi:iron complex outermembrane receptor protein